MKPTSPSCLVCHSQHTTRLYEIVCPIAPQIKYSLHQCTGCGSRFFDPREHAVDIEYENEEFSLHESYISTAFKRNPYWEDQVKTIATLHKGKVRSILDCGCRTGDFLMHWPENVGRTGVEIVAAVAAVAKSRGLNVINIPLEKATLTQQFDVVTCFAILEHLTEPETVLDALTKAVAPSGILTIMVPSHESLKAKLQKSHWHQYYPPFHLAFFSRGYLNHFMNLRDFERISTVYTSGGMFNPFTQVPFLGKVWAKFMSWFDKYSPSRYVPIFDHMYIHYRKK